MDDVIGGNLMQKWPKIFYYEDKIEYQYENGLRSFHHFDGSISMIYAPYIPDCFKI